MSNNKGVRVQRPGGHEVIVRRSDRSDKRTNTKNAYYRGGTVGGIYFPAGYYPDPFWNYTFLESVLDNRPDNPLADQEDNTSTQDVD